MLSKEWTHPSQRGIREEETGSRGCEHRTREEGPWAETWERETQREREREREREIIGRL